MKHLVLVHIKVDGDIDDREHVTAMTMWILKHVFRISKPDRKMYGKWRSCAWLLQHTDKAVCVHDAVVVVCCLMLLTRFSWEAAVTRQYFETLVPIVKDRLLNMVDDVSESLDATTLLTSGVGADGGMSRGDAWTAVCR